MIESMVNGLTELVAKGYALCFIPMHYDQDKEIAQVLAREVKETALKKNLLTKEELCQNIEVVDKNLSIKEVLAYTAGFDMVIGMRLHSLIMAAACHVPMLGISYDPKVTAFVNEMKVPYCIDSDKLTEECFTKMVLELESHLEDEKKQLKALLEQKQDRIYLPAKCIKEQLNKK